MAHLTANLILYRLNETLANMAESILGFFYTTDARESFDVVNMLFVGWILLGILVYFLGTFIASQFERVRASPEEQAQNPSDASSNSKSDGIDPKSDKKCKPINRQNAQLDGTGSVGPGGIEEQITVAQALADLQGAPRVGPLAHVPIASGSDPNTVRWINHILVWLYTTTKTPLLTDCLLHSLNDQTIKTSTENGLLVEFEKLTPKGPKPEIRDVHVSSESSNNVTFTCKILARQLLLNLLATRTMGKERTSADYDLVVDRIDAKVKVTCNTEDRLLVVRFIDRPDVKLNLKLAAGALKTSSLDQRALEDSIIEIAIQALSSAVVDLHFSQDQDFPKFMRQKVLTPTLYGSTLDSSPSVARHERRLFVKVIKASNLGADRGCQEVYCVVEIDEPPQRFQTSGLKATNSPFWDEHFLFNVSNASAELLFEIYDRGKRTGENFLGLGIVSVEELLKNPSQRQIIALQSRPLENDKVTGSLTVEFLFMEGSEIPTQSGRNVETCSRITPGGALVTTTTIKKPENEDEIDERDITDTALRELENMGKPGMSTNKSTLIIHSVQRELVRPTVKTNGESVSGSVSPSSPVSKGAPSIANSESSTPSDNENRSARSKDRKSFMGTLRKRLSFKKNRSKSVDQKGIEVMGQASPSSSRSVSADRSKSVPGSRETSAGRHAGRLDVPGGGSTRSSISEGSGFSGTSTKTYINENSTLVVEMNENGITKHYLIPFSLASKSKWRKRGTKLHIYNDHTFVAKHISGSIDCQVCSRRFPRRPGKQAYACRDCDLQCHKTCHVKVDSRCPSSNIHTLEMEYVQDPRAGKLKPS